MPPTIPVQAEEVVILTGISWEDYKRRNDAVEGRSPRMTYDGGVLELMTLGVSHERPSWFTGRLFEELARGFGIDFTACRSTTFRREDLQKGFEGDGSYYIRRASLIRNKERIDLSVDPPPELVVEIDISRQSMKKLPMFAAMGVEEVWRYRDGQLFIFVLKHGQHQIAPASLALPLVTAEDLNQLLSARQDRSDSAWMDMVLDWARTRRSQS